MKTEQDEHLKIGVFQMDILWEDPTGNFDKIKAQLNVYGNQLDVLVLPEMFTTGFSMEASSLAWSYQHPGFIRMSALAIHYKCSIIGSVWFKDQEQYFNRCFHWNSNGETEFYDKVHAFTLVKEDQYITPGNIHPFFYVRNWKIKPQICYDLRFPKGSYNLWKEPYDLLLYVANWPEKRIGAWDILLKARAVENQSYVIGVNRVGKEPKHVQYSGHSTILSYTGEELKGALENNEEIMVVILEKKPQIEFRNRFPFIKDEI